MNRVLRIARGAISGVCLGLAIGVGIGGLMAFLAWATSDPLERWDTATKVLVLAAAVGAWVGVVGGASSQASSRALPLAKSVAVVAISSILALFLVIVRPLPNPKTNAFFLVPAAGAIVGGIVAAFGRYATDALNPTTRQ